MYLTTAPFFKHTLSTFSNVYTYNPYRETERKNIIFLCCIHISRSLLFIRLFKVNVSQDQIKIINFSKTFAQEFSYSVKQFNYRFLRSSSIASLRSTNNPFAGSWRRAAKVGTKPFSPE
jgi:hypothetical protein